MDDLEQYKIQLSQINSLLEIESNDELEELKKDIEEAIELIELQSSIDQVSREESTKTEQKVESTSTIKQENEVIVLESESSDDELDTKKEDQNEVIVLDDDDLNEYDELIGESYSVPFVVDGKMEMHEAEIIRIVEVDQSGDAKLEVKFLHPLNESMRYCSDCKVKNCPFNHGHFVDLSMLKDSIDRRELELNSNCLFSKDDEYWSRGKVVDKKFGLYTVRSDSTQELLTLRLAELCLFDQNSNTDQLNIIINEEDDLRLDESDNRRKNFETTYSNSIGLKLLQKQGYQVGEGLGKNRDGIVNPIELSILPANTSLDTCMELKAKGHLLTSSDTLTYEKQKNYFKNLILIKNSKKVKRKTIVENSKMFRTLNHTLATKSTQTKSTCAYSNVKSLQNETRHVNNMNVDILNVENEIKRLRTEIQHCKKAISLCKEMNPSNLKKLNVKLCSKETELSRNELKYKLLKEKKKRKDYDRNIKHF